MAIFFAETAIYISVFNIGNDFKSCGCIYGGQGSYDDCLCSRKYCTHYSVCKAISNDTTACNQFKDKSRIVELPCKIGDELNGEIVHQIDFEESESQGEVRREGFVHTMNKEDLDSIVFCSHPIPWEALRKEREK